MRANLPFFRHLPRLLDGGIADVGQRRPKHRQSLPQTTPPQSQRQRQPLVPIQSQPGVRLLQQQRRPMLGRRLRQIGVVVGGQIGQLLQMDLNLGVVGGQLGQQLVTQAVASVGGISVGVIFHR